MLKMRGITKNFGAVQALSNASLTVNAGEIHALLGSNGSGKSTMIKTLAGIVNPTSGQIFVDDKPVHINSGSDARALGIATAFQDLSSVPTMTVMDNIMLGREKSSRLGLIDKKAARREVNELLERFKLDCDPDAYVQTLMPSTQSMLEVAKAVYSKPRLLLLDEVTASLHHDEIETLFSILRELRQQGVAMIYVTHRMKEIFELCDHATILRSGLLITDGNLSEMTMDDIVFHMTGQRPDAKSTTDAPDCTDFASCTTVLHLRDIALEPKVKDISMQAYAGQIVGIGGLEGQGQPELIRTILGVNKPDTGTIEYQGKEVQFRSAAQAVQQNMGFVSGERGREAIFAARTVEENICAGMFVRGNLFTPLLPKKVRDYANRAMEQYKIKAGNLQDPASSLSGGNQQKLVVARWLSENPTLLLLDDPTKGVDIHSRNEIHAILRDCAAQGMTVILSSSENEELLDVADCIYVFYEGQVSAVLSGPDKTGEKLVAAMMGMTLTTTEEGGVQQ